MTSPVLGQSIGEWWPMGPNSHAVSAGVRMRKQSLHYTRRPQQRTSLEVLQQLLEHRGRDNESLAVVQISAGEQLGGHARPAQRVQMNRHMLLNECRKDTRPFDPQHQHCHKLRSLSRSSSPVDPSDAATAREQVRTARRPVCGHPAHSDANPACGQRVS